jgi:hypothetical protein
VTFTPIGTPSLSLKFDMLLRAFVTTVFCPVMVEHLDVVDRLSQTHVDDDLLDLGYLHGIPVVKLFLHLRNYFAFISL